MPRSHARKRKLLPRPLLIAGAGLAVAIFGAGGGGETQPPPVGTLKGPPTCDAGVCLPDGGLANDAGFCACPIGTD